MQEEQRLSRLQALVVEDDPTMFRLIGNVLRSSRFDVRSATSGEAALDLYDTRHPDIVFVDILLQGEMDGYELCRRLRSSSSVPIIVLTGQGEVEHKVRGFEAGADDYVTKPFSSRELLARTEAVLRRCAPPRVLGKERSLVLGDLEIDPSQRRATLAGTEIPLTPTEFNLLHELAMAPNRVLTHESLLEAVWGPEYREEIDYLRAYIWRLRGKVEEDPSHPRRILSKIKFGYMLAVD